jgi:hypothetical protein
MNRFLRLNTGIRIIYWNDRLLDVKSEELIIIIDSN